MGCSGREAAPEVYDGRIVADGDHVDQLILERGIAVDGCVDGRMQLDDLIGAAHIVPEPIHECRILMEQCSERLHVVVVPSALKRVGCVFGLFHLNHEDPDKRLYEGVQLKAPLERVMALQPAG
jgi:hypothetical protein